MITTEQVISIGHITRTHGKRGEIQCLTTNEYWDNAEATFLILNIDKEINKITASRECSAADAYHGIGNGYSANLEILIRAAG